MLVSRELTCALEDQVTDGGHVMLDESGQCCFEVDVIVGLQVRLKTTTTQ